MQRDPNIDPAAYTNFGNVQIPVLGTPRGSILISCAINVDFLSGSIDRLSSSKEFQGLRTERDTQDEAHHYIFLISSTSSSLEKAGAGETQVPFPNVVRPRASSGTRTPNAWKTDMEAIRQQMGAQRDGESEKDNDDEEESESESSGGEAQSEQGERAPRDGEVETRGRQPTTSPLQARPQPQPEEVQQPSPVRGAPTARGTGRGRGRGRGTADRTPSRTRSERIANALLPRSPPKAVQQTNAAEPALTAAQSRSRSPQKKAGPRKRLPTTPSGPPKPPAKRGRCATAATTPRLPAAQQQTLGLSPMDVDAAMAMANQTDAPPTSRLFGTRPRRVSFNVDTAEQSSPYRRHFPAIPKSPEIRPGYAPRPQAGASRSDFADFDPRTDKITLTRAELAELLAAAAQSPAARSMANLTNETSGIPQARQRRTGAEHGRGQEPKPSFEPRNQAAELSAQLAEHFERIIERADFQPNFHRYRTYSERIFQRWVAHPTWAIGDWQENMYQRVCDEDRDRRWESKQQPFRDEGARHSFRDDAGARQPFRNDEAPDTRRFSQQKPKENGAPRGPRKENGGGGSSGRCIFCGINDGHNTWRCDALTGRCRLSQNFKSAGTSILKKDAPASANLSMHAPYAAPAPPPAPQPHITRSGAPAQDELFPIVTPLKADRWEYWITKMGQTEEYADVPKGIRNGFPHGLDISRRLATTFIPRNLASALEQPEIIDAYILKEQTLGCSRLVSLYRFSASFNVASNAFIKFSIPQTVAADVAWWRAALSQETVEREIREPPPPEAEEIFVDASTSWGIGLVFKGSVASLEMQARVEGGRA
ncbi:hypothetical protein B0H13DRAFT_1850063 [Mycena leptocephala]|nr:hypothetical protein B0H13DRAFT_1850063 [Mycena leptocephala]